MKLKHREIKPLRKPGASKTINLTELIVPIFNYARVPGSCTQWPLSSAFVSLSF